MAISLPRYETDQLIPLVGSKRPVAEQLRLILSSLRSNRGQTLFLDPFCGSGVVSRIARSLGMDVRANDVEPFSYIINHVYLALHNDHLSSLFPDMGGLDAYLSMLHLEGLYASQSEQGVMHPYLSAHYAPADDRIYDGDRERLFFTAANARYLDTVREEIENSWLEKRITAREKAVVLAAILYEASRKANTSGTFTSYHKRFFTANRAVRTRIVEPCMLQAPVLPDDSVPTGEMHLGDASDFVKNYRADICFLDPPATVHQYGSAYHLLNSITLWDKVVPSSDIDGSGRLSERAGIRHDWKQTHSPFCSLKHADRAFVHLLEHVDARHIVLTYPSDGLVGTDRLYELLSVRNAPVSVLPLYRRNQGGRQNRQGKRQVEQLFITGKPAAFTLSVGDGLTMLPLFERLDALLSVVFRRVQDVQPFCFIGGVTLDGLPSTEQLMALSTEQLIEKIELLEQEACTTDGEALTVLLLACANSSGVIDGVGRARLEKRLFSLLRRTVESLKADELEKMSSRFDDLLDQLGTTDDSTKVLRQRLSSFFKMAYDRDKEKPIV